MALFLQGFMKTADLNNMANTTGRALKQTQTGQSMMQTGEKLLKNNTMLNKARSINLLGGGPSPASQTIPQGTNIAQRATMPKPSLSIKDANRLQLDAGKFQASLSNKGLNASMGLGGGLSLGASQKGSSRSAGIFFKKEF